VRGGAGQHTMATHNDSNSHDILTQLQHFSQHRPAHQPTDASTDPQTQTQTQTQIQEHADELLNSQLELIALTTAPKTETEAENGNGNKTEIVEADAVANPVTGHAHEIYPLLRVSSGKSANKHVPPLNFGHVSPGVFRSGHPQPANYAFLETLKLRTVLYVGDTTTDWRYYSWIQSQGLSFIHLPLPASQDELAALSPQQQQCALERLAAVVAIIAAAEQNGPLLVHSNKGKHRVGVAIGAARQVLDRWALAAVYAEHSLYIGGGGGAGGGGAKGGAGGVRGALIDVAEQHWN
jgi:phosphoglycolate phosphatase-like HAD superfamily hydrolase